MTGTRAGQRPYLVIDGEPYYLALRGGRPVFSSGTRALEGVPSDAGEIVWDNWTKGIGHDYLRADHMLTDVQGYLIPAPVPTAINANYAIGPARYYFEETDTNGRFYGFFVCTKGIVKVDIGTTAAIRQNYTLATSGFNSNDRIGQPFKATSGGTTYIYFPVNNGDRLVKMTLPVTADTGSDSGTSTSTSATTMTDSGAAWTVDQWIGHVVTLTGSPGGTMTVTSNTATVLTGAAWSDPGDPGETLAYAIAPVADTFTAVTTVTKGAAHSLPLPSGKVMRLVSSHSSGTFQNRCQISILQPGADPETDANWGGDFELGSQETYGLGMVSYGELAVIRKQDGWSVAAINSDGTIRFEDILPDGPSFEKVALGAESAHDGAVWHGKLLLPTPSGLWRSVTSSTLPRGPDTIPSNSAMLSSGTLPVRFGNFSSVAGGQGYAFAAYNRTATTTTGACVLMAREGGPGDGEFTWHSLLDHFGVGGSVDTKYSLMALQRNGTGAPALWFTSVDGTDPDNDLLQLRYLPLANDLSPWSGFAKDVKYGRTNGIVELMPVYFPSRVLLREMHFTLEGSAGTGEGWGLTASLDGAAAAAVGSDVTATGSVFWTAGSNDTCRTLYPTLRHTAITGGGGSTDPLRASRARLSFYYLPDVGDTLSFVVDVKKTAGTRHSQETVLANLKALRKAGAKTFVDLYGTGSQYVLVDSVDDEAAKRIAGVEDSHLATVTATLLEYS